MRFILNFGIFIAIIALFVNYALRDVNKLNDTLNCHSIYENSNYQEAIGCYEGLYKKYKSPYFKYNSALSAFYNDDFINSKNFIADFLAKEKNDSKLRQRALLFMDEIYLKEKSGYSQKKHYINMTSSTTWVNPKNLKVYIQKESDKSNNFNKAFLAWDEALGDILDFEYVSTPQEADINCEFADEIPYNSDFIGVAIVKHYKNEKNPNKKHFLNVNIKVLRKSPHTGEYYNDDQIYATALHEIGHALGVNIHSPYKDDIMFANTESQMYQKAHLSSHDVSSVKRLYEYLF